MIFVDSNVPMYLVGADHPNKHIARGVLERLVESAEGLATDAEVLQEILHRYVAINRRDAIEPAIDVLRGIVDEVYPVEEADVLAAQRLLSTGRLSARDAIHVAIMQRHEVHSILSFDGGFDSVPGLTRISS